MNCTLSILVFGRSRSPLLAVSLVLLTLNGCATLGPRTTGTDGSVEWKATDLRLERKGLGSVWVYSFVLELRDTQRRRLTFPDMEFVIYQPGTGSHQGRSFGPWRLPEGGVLRFPLSSSLRCGPVEGNCTGTLMPIPLWRITLTGTDEGGQPVRAVIDLRLPADPPTAAQ